MATLSLSQQLAEMKVENERLQGLLAKAVKSADITVELTEAGTFAINGIKKGPPSNFTKAQFVRLIEKSADVISFMEANEEAAKAAAASYVKPEPKKRDSKGEAELASVG